MIKEVSSDPRGCVVTGAASGIGREIALRLLDEGWFVLGVDIDADQLNEVASNPKFSCIVGDVSRPDVHDAAAKAVAAKAPLVGWVNSAGIDERQSLHELSQTRAERALAINLMGTVWGSASAVRQMLVSGGGSIVCLSSTQATAGFVGYPIYAASKGGVEALVRQTAAEYAHRGIRSNAIAPGVIVTQMNEMLLQQSADPVSLSASWDLLCPIGRWGTVQDVAVLALYLLGDSSGFMTGQTIVLDGGQTIVPPNRITPLSE